MDLLVQSNFCCSIIAKMSDNLIICKVTWFERDCLILSWICICRQDSVLTGQKYSKQEAKKNNLVHISQNIIKIKVYVIRVKIIIITVFVLCETFW